MSRMLSCINPRIIQYPPPIPFTYSPLSLAIAGTGDSFILAFHTAHDAALFAVGVQAALLGCAWPEEVLALQVRLWMTLHVTQLELLQGRWLVTLCLITRLHTPSSVGCCGVLCAAQVVRSSMLPYVLSTAKGALPPGPCLATWLHSGMHSLLDALIFPHCHALQ